MAGTRRSLLTDLHGDGGNAIALVEERHVLFPGKAGHDAQPASLGLVWCADTPRGISRPVCLVYPAGH